MGAEGAGACGAVLGPGRRNGKTGGELDRADVASAGGGSAASPRAHAARALATTAAASGRSAAQTSHVATPARFEVSQTRHGQNAVIGASEGGFRAASVWASASPWRSDR
jgi:hypothetical protein